MIGAPFVTEKKQNKKPWRSLEISRILVKHTQVTKYSLLLHILCLLCREERSFFYLFLLSFLFRQLLLFWPDEFLALVCHYPSSWSPFQKRFFYESLSELWDDFPSVSSLVPEQLISVSWFTLSHACAPRPQKANTNGCFDSPWQPTIKKEVSALNAPGIRNV